MLENQDLVGFESFCLTYFVLNRLDTKNEYPETVALSKQLCEDFYSKSIVGEFQCGEELENCLDDEEFYAQALDVVNASSEDFAEPMEPFFYLTNMIIDDYVFAYGNGFDEFKKYVNFYLLKNIEYKRNLIQIIEGFEQIDSCMTNAHLYFDLLKALAVKSDFVDDTNLLSQHAQVEQGVLALCSDHYADYREVILEQGNLGSTIEAYYLFEGKQHQVDVDNHINSILNRGFSNVSYMGERYSVLDEYSPIDEAYAEPDGFWPICNDREISYSGNLKTSFYLLVYSIYGD